MSRNGEKYNVWAFYPENYTEKKWLKLFAEMMKKYFDPFLQDFEKHVREEYSLEQACGINITAYKKCKEKSRAPVRFVHQAQKENPAK